MNKTTEVQGKKNRDINMNTLFKGREMQRCQGISALLFDLHAQNNPHPNPNKWIESAKECKDCVKTHMSKEG